jgi:hypothetical protein
MAYRPVARQQERNKQSVVYRQWPTRNKGSICASGVFCVVHSEKISRCRSSSVQLMKCSWLQRSELVTELVSGLLRFSRCELLLLEAGSWGMEIVRQLRVTGTSAVASLCQETTGENIEGWEVLVRAVVNCRVCELITFCKCSMNPITNPISFYSHSYTWQYFHLFLDYFRRFTSSWTIVEWLGV